MKFIKIILFVVLSVNILFAQDKAEYQKKFIWDKEKDILTCDFSKIKRPQLKDFKTQAFHFEPIRQDTAGTCWAFSTTSFFESEIYRLHSKEIKLSEIYAVYQTRPRRSILHTPRNRICLPIFLLAFYAASMTNLHQRLLYNCSPLIKQFKNVKSIKYLIGLLIYL